MRRLPFLLLIGVLLPSAVLAQSPSTAAAAPPPRAPADAAPPSYGMVTHYLDAEVSERLAELGADMARVDFDWFRIEARCKGCFDWTGPDEGMRQASSRNQKLFATLAYTPEWANGGKPHNHPPLEMSDWYDFVSACVSRYPQIRYWGLWNEPNIGSFLRAKRAVYYELIRTGRRAVKAGNPGALVLGPDVSWHALEGKWFARTMKAVGDQFDMLTVHWYPDGPPLARIMDERVRPYARGKPVWLTEVGRQACEGDGSEFQQASVYVRALQAFARRRAWWTAVFFYDLLEPDRCSWGAVRPDGTPRPAFDVLRAWIAEDRR